MLEEISEEELHRGLLAMYQSGVSNPAIDPNVCSNCGLAFDSKEHMLISSHCTPDSWLTKISQKPENKVSFFRTKSVFYIAKPKDIIATGGATNTGRFRLFGKSCDKKLGAPYEDYNFNLAGAVPNDAMLAIALKSLWSAEAVVFNHIRIRSAELEWILQKEERSIIDSGRSCFAKKRAVRLLREKFSQIAVDNSNNNHTLITRVRSLRDHIRISKLFVLQDQVLNISGYAGQGWFNSTLDDPANDSFYAVIPIDSGTRILRFSFAEQPKYNCSIKEILDSAYITDNQLYFTPGKHKFSDVV